MFDTSIAKVIYAYKTNKNHYCNQEEFNFVKKNHYDNKYYLSECKKIS